MNALETSTTPIEGPCILLRKQLLIGNKRLLLAEKRMRDRLQRELQRRECAAKVKRENLEASIREIRNRDTDPGAVIKFVLNEMACILRHPILFNSVIVSLGATFGGPLTTWAAKAGWIPPLDLTNGLYFLIFLLVTLLVSWAFFLVLDMIWFVADQIFVSGPNEHKARLLVSAERSMKPLLKTIDQDEARARTELLAHCRDLDDFFRGPSIKFDPSRPLGAPSQDFH